MQSSGAFVVPRHSGADLELLRTTAGAALLEHLLLGRSERITLPSNFPERL